MALIRRLTDRLIQKRVAFFEEELLQKYYAEVENMYAKMRGWRHDYRHHIQTMKVHAARGEMEEIQKYLDMLDDDLTNVETVVKTGNRIADAILNSKLSLARERRIQVKTKAEIPVLLSVPELDLCIIIGNLLDNAMEACMRVKKKENRFIRIYIDIIKKQLYLSVTNSTEGHVRKNGNQYLSSKQGLHGFGILRIDNIVSKYHGYINRQSEPGVFATEVTLPLAACLENVKGM